jgi:flagellar biosynthesis/type III secretory pathway protein FliH
MPRQFFTLKSILTAPPGTFGSSNGLGGGSSTTNSAVLEEGHGSGTGAGNLALSDDSVIEIDDVEESYGAHHDEEYEEEEEIEGAPPTADEEVLYQDEPNHDEEVEVQQAIPQQVQEYIQQMQQQMQMMAQQLQYHQQQEHERQQQLAQRPQEPEMAPPVARFANFVVYDGSFEPLQNQVGQILSEAINEVMRLRARAAEAFERKAEDMLADLAMTVLGRELRTAPADLAAIVAQMRARMGEESAVVIRVAPEEAHFIDGPVKPDPNLSYGDLVFDVEDGELDLRLGTRIAAVLREQQVQV